MAASESNVADSDLDAKTLVIPEKYTDVVVDGKNAGKVVCSNCRSLVLLPTKAEFINKQISLPNLEQKVTSPAGEPSQCEELCQHWLVHDMFTFENIGFTKDVGNIKYLACADCEIGPIGMMDKQNQSDFYVALDRVCHTA